MKRIQICVSVLLMLGVLTGCGVAKDGSTSENTALYTPKPVQKTIVTIPVSLGKDDPMAVSAYIKSIATPNNYFGYDGQRMTKDVSTYLDGQISYSVFSKSYHDNLNDMQEELTKMEGATIPKGAVDFASVWVDDRKQSLQMMKEIRACITSDPKASRGSLQHLKTNLDSIAEQTKVLMTVANIDQQKAVK